ncbi:MAG: DUF6385 domain-containing protein [Candidatus Gastranaerophilales bacterium]|nr:DUF6385 domain-containing protein [Candidatus Gastranaerophilales bacterium]
MQIYRLNFFSEKIVNKCEEFITSNETSFTGWLNTSNCVTYTFFIHNIGFKPAYICAQVSPDKVAIINDPYVTEIAPKETIAIVAQKYGFYTRIAFKSLNLFDSTNLRVIFQAQLR